MSDPPSVCSIDRRDAELLLAGEHRCPHTVLGPHLQPGRGLVVRAWHPDAVRVDWLPASGKAVEMSAIGRGLFAAWMPLRRTVPRYQLRFHFADGAVYAHRDPYRFAPTVAADDLRKFAAGDHRRAGEVLGANLDTIDGVTGTRFAVWAPRARGVRVVGDFCAWDGRLLPMRLLRDSGVFELFVPGVEAGAHYKFEVLTRDRRLLLKSDPFGRAMAPPPVASSRVDSSSFRWRDGGWLARRRKADPLRRPLSIYEVHVGSWAGEPASLRDLAPRLVAHAKRFGFTHLELMPLAEHGYYPSWGYLVTGYFAVTGRYGPPDDLRFFVDHCHRSGIGVLLDWVPAHFPVDAYGLVQFDGAPLFERSDDLAKHADWGTLMFDFARPEVRSFLVSNALYWLRSFHFDGLRIDATSWILYFDYLSGGDEWRPNPAGVEFLRAVQRGVAKDVPGAIVTAEESTAWPGVTKPVAAGGLGLTFKWNMGWMNDTLGYLATPLAERASAQHRLTFGMLYEYDEHFINAISHDEVVHGKRSLREKMPGDDWQKLANLRLLLAYQFTRPGKQLMFMGTELASSREWDHDQSLEWHLMDVEPGRSMATFVAALGVLYHRHPCLWRRDPDPEGFAWIDGSDVENGVVSFVRRDGAQHLVVVVHCQATPCESYRVGVPAAGHYRTVFNSDDACYGGSGYPTVERVSTEEVACWGWRRSVEVALPPLAVTVLAPYRVRDLQEPPAGTMMRSH